MTESETCKHATAHQLQRQPFAIRWNQRRTSELTQPRPQGYQRGALDARMALGTNGRLVLTTGC